jgi:diguanylate cyclase (GGDEF)-like protein
MEVLLYRWSTLAQIASSLTIAVFFAVLARSVRRRELAPWVRAWFANGLALAVTVGFWFAQPSSRIGFAFSIWGYIAAKTTFVLLLASGALAFRVTSTAAWGVTGVATRGRVLMVAVATGVAAALIPSIDVLGAVQSGAIAVVLLTTSILLLRRSGRGMVWLATGFALRGGLALVESASYLTQVVPTPWSASPGMRLFLAAQSSFDSGAEWVVALGCVLAVYRTIQDELTQANARLVDAHQTLQQVADRDPLTALANRRALPGILRRVYDSGGTILFFDLDGFKQINDAHGHDAGDACLRRFARALQDSFRPDDHIVRYAGDEFLVIAPQAQPEQLTASVDRVRERLDASRGTGPAIRFSMGAAVMPAQGDAAAAIRAADAEMYRRKAAALA